MVIFVSRNVFNQLPFNLFFQCTLFLYFVFHRTAVSLCRAFSFQLIQPKILFQIFISMFCHSIWRFCHRHNHQSYYYVYCMWVYIWVWLCAPTFCCWCCAFDVRNLFRSRLFCLSHIINFRLFFFFYYSFLFTILIETLLSSVCFFWLASSAAFSFSIWLSLDHSMWRW